LTQEGGDPDEEKKAEADQEAETKPEGEEEPVGEEDQAVSRGEVSVIRGAHS
jgi:hypothetical protein